MTVATAPKSVNIVERTKRPLSVADLPELLRAMGDIPPERVFVDPPPGMATEADVVRLVDGDYKVLCELVDGTLVEKALSIHAAFLATAIAHYLRLFVVARNLGIVTGSDTMMRMMGGNIRLPDVCYVAWRDIPGGKLPDVAVGRFPVTLAVEVLSPGNTKKEMSRKRKDYFESGTQLVWEFNPVTRTVAIYASPDNPKILDQTGTLDGGAVLPGFTLELAKLFAELDRSAATPPEMPLR